MKWSDSGGHEYEQAPIGTFVARCIRMIDIGTQRGEYEGRVNMRRQCILAWELPTELMSEGDSKGKPFIVSAFFTASLNEKAKLRKFLESWRGRAFTAQELMGFDSKNIIGKACLLSLIANDKGKTRVSAVMAITKGTTVPAQVNPSLYFSLDDFDAKVYESLSEGIRKMIAVSPEYVEAVKPQVGNLPKDELEDGFDAGETAPF